MTILPFQRDDVVQCEGQIGIVEDIRGETVLVRTDDGMDHITTQARLRAQQAPVRRGLVA
jgi:hypothetical protein